MKPLRTRIEGLEARAVKALNTALILFREPLPGEIEAHRQHSNGPIFILNFSGPETDRTEQPIRNDVERPEQQATPHGREVSNCPARVEAP